MCDQPAEPPASELVALEAGPAVAPALATPQVQSKEGQKSSMVQSETGNEGDNEDNEDDDRKTTTAALEAYVPEAQPMLRKQIHYHCFV